MAKGIKFADLNAQCQQTLNDMKHGKFSPVYLLHGDDPYFIDLIDRYIAEFALDEDSKAFNQMILYGLDTDPGTVQSCLRQMPMMGNRMVVILREAQSMSSKIEALEPYVSNPLQTSILVICYKNTDRKRLDQRSRFYKACQANGVVIETIQPKEYEIGGFIRSFVASRNRTINQRSVEVLVNHMGTDLSRISRELDKLAVALPADAKEIGEDDIEKYIGISKRYNIYELLNAVMYRKMNDALSIARHMMDNTKETPAIVVIKMMYTLFRNLFTVNYLKWRSDVRHEPVPSPAEMLRILHTTEHGRNELTLCAAKWDNRRVFSALGLLREYDARCKGIGRGDYSDSELINELILKIFML